VSDRSRHPKYFARKFGKYAKIEAFAREHGIDSTQREPAFPSSNGRTGVRRSGALVVASDSHSNLYGAMAALGTPVVRTDAASIWPLE